MSPRMSPAKFLQDQGGIEGILQEAARGFYSRGEKWGVAKALRGAVQGLQSGNQSPRTQAGGSHGSLDEGRVASDISASLTTRIRALEQRNQALAKMLQNAVEDLWIQQKTLIQDETKSAADAISLAVAKVQFVQVYLENPGMRFPAENTTSEETEAAKSSSIARNKADGTANENADSIPGTSASEPDETSTDPQTPTRPSLKDASHPSSNGDIALRIQPAGPAVSAADNHRVAERPGPFPFHRPRPSLAHSSFSWMLGEDQRKSSFISASPFPSEKRMARGKAGFLFGDDKGEGSKHSGKAKGQVDEDCEDETITLDYLKGAAGMAG